MCSRTAFSRPRPEVFKAKAKDLEAMVEATDLCDEGQSSMVAQKVWNPQVHGSNNCGYLCVDACMCTIRNWL